MEGMSTERSRREKLRTALRDARLRAGLRQIDVALVLGRPQSFVAKIESGERKVDLIDVLNICDAIDLDPHLLINALV
jgi:transcriptional regulator with XRE-family HTH domain